MPGGGRTHTPGEFQQGGGRHDPVCQREGKDRRAWLVWGIAALRPAVKVAGPPRARLRFRHRRGELRCTDRPTVAREVKIAQKEPLRGVRLDNRIPGRNNSITVGRPGTSPDL